MTIREESKEARAVLFGALLLGYSTGQDWHRFVPIAFCIALGWWTAALAMVAWQNRKRLP